MRIPLLLATLASCARPAASFASMPSDAIPADDLTEALVELALANCTGDERASYTPGVETAAAAVVEKGDGNSDGMITRGEYEVMRQSAEEEVGDAADAVIATLQPGECVAGHMLEKTSAATSVQLIVLVHIVLRFCAILPPHARIPAASRVCEWLL